MFSLVLDVGCKKERDQRQRSLAPSVLVLLLGCNVCLDEIRSPARRLAQEPTVNGPPPTLPLRTNVVCEESAVWLVPISTDPALDLSEVQGLSCSLEKHNNALCHFPFPLVSGCSAALNWTCKYPQKDNVFKC